MTWKAIVGEEKREQLQTLLRAYASGPISVHPVPSLSSGFAGAALFWGSLALELDDAPSLSRCEEALERAMDSMASIPSNACLHQGVTGVAWLLHHFHRRGLVECPDETTSELELLLLERLRHQRFPVYGLFDGLVGLGVYGLERLPSAWAREFLGEVVRQLAALAIETGQGTTWRDLFGSPEAERPQPRADSYNLRLTHGVPGVVSVLARCAAAGIHREQASHLARLGADWVLAQRQEGRFPSLFIPGGPPTQHWDGWGSGSAGVGIALLSAGRALGDTRLEQEALSILLDVAARPEPEADLEDAGIWFGSAGLAHIFNRAFQATGEPCLYEAALSWLQRTVRFARHSAEGSFWMHTSSRSDHFLSGGLGTALVLLTASSSNEPTWDRILMTDVQGSDPRA
ncbi:lanthionine synthetase C family protein [Archangium lansingense]|uniref:Lanthionine synthetase C family protein n=1 Tax=Archangium lansingense TaxID=2995310 RepID=A0ABT4A802_9BACT|nr:lanthionine synthetase C family protein [Archangium lansinium]MCY1077792.1 lanthionine synthetase C family protein [Archangium lansinium]